MMLQHGDGKGILDIFPFDHLASLLLLSCDGFDSNHGCLSDLVEADLDGDFFVFHAGLLDNEFEGTLLDSVLDTVLISVSEDTLQFFVASLDLVIGHTCNPQLKYLRCGIS